MIEGNKIEEIDSVNDDDYKYEDFNVDIVDNTDNDDGDEDKNLNESNLSQIKQFKQQYKIGK